MLLTVNLRPETYSRILSLIASGAYASPAAFLQVAVENQLVAEEAHSRAWHPAVQASGPQAAPVENEVSVPPPEPPFVSQPGLGGLVPDLERLRHELRTPALNDLSPCAPTPELANEWPFGQVNRLFPLKLICRLLLSSAEDRRWPEPPRALARLEQVAQKVGVLLSRMDGQAGRGRDQALATSFPGDEEASVARFLAIFAGRMTTVGARPGAVCSYQLACFDHKHFGLTAHGMEFARLFNPLLDGTSEPAGLLSSEEQRFLVGVIRTSVPGERWALSRVLRAVARGATRFEDVVTAVQPDVPPQWSAAFIKSQISGAIGRAHELGLLGKQRAGRHVDYSLTASGAVLGAFSEPGKDDDGQAA